MKAQDLVETSEACQQVLATLLVQTRPILDARFTDLEDEVTAGYLANLKAGVNNMAEALIDLSRRCDAAVTLWRLREPRSMNPYVAPSTRVLMKGQEK